jgi:hypothetical protein
MAERERIYATARTLHLAIDQGDPDVLLLGLVREQASVVAWLREQVRDLTPEALVRSARYSRRATTTGGEGTTETTTVETGTQEHLLSQMYSREKRIYADLLVKVAGLGIAARQVELAKEQGELAGRLLVAVLTDMGIDPASPRAREVIRRQFTVIAGGAG